MFVRKHGNIRTNSNVAHIQNDNHYNGSWNVVIDGMLFAIEKQTHTPNFCYYFSKLFDGNVFVLSFILWSNLALNEHRLRIQTHWNDVIIYRKSITFSNFKSVCNVMFSQKLYFNAISFSSHRRRKNICSHLLYGIKWFFLFVSANFGHCGKWNRLRLLCHRIDSHIYMFEHQCFVSFGNTVIFRRRNKKKKFVKLLAKVDDIVCSVCMVLFLNRLVWLVFVCSKVKRNG